MNFICSEPSLGCALLKVALLVLFAWLAFIVGVIVGGVDE